MHRLEVCQDKFQKSTFWRENKYSTKVKKLSYVETNLYNFSHLIYQRLYSNLYVSFNYIFCFYFLPLEVVTNKFTEQP